MSESNDVQEHEPWSEEKAYDEEIAPLMTKIIEICKARKIPMIASFLYEDADIGKSFCTSFLSWRNRPAPKSFFIAHILLKEEMTPLLTTIITTRKD